MRNSILVLCWLGLANVAMAASKLKVVATLPDLAAVAAAVGGDKVQVTSLAGGAEDPHFVDPKPSFIRTLNRADVLVQGGLELEAGWLPPLLDNARNAAILPGRPGHIDASASVPRIGVPAGPVDRSQGDVHLLGNPHYLLDPLNGKIVAENIARGLAAVDRDGAAFYSENARRFGEELEKRTKAWAASLAPFRGTKVVTYHRSFDYFLNRFGLELAGTIEPKPGIEPSPTHLNALIEQTRAASVKLIIAEPNRSRRTASYVADAIGAKLVIAPILVGGHPKASDYFSLFNYITEQTVSALKNEGTP